VDLSPDTIVGLGSAALAIVSAIVSGASASRANRQAAELERQRRKETASEAAQRILNQYRDPLLDAAQTLQGRAYNIVGDNFFGRYLHCGDPVEEGHARDYTVYAIAEYLCWAEIVRRELRFLDDDVDAANPHLLTYLANIQLTLQTDRIPLPFRVFRGPQRAIAELMMVPTNSPEGPRSEAMGYAAFRHRLENDREFAAWFERLRYADIDAVAASTPGVDQRLAMLQHDLIDLIDYLDPKALRVPAQIRSRVSAERPQIPGRQPIVAQRGKGK
jgi:hypothetical protein